MYQVKPKIFGNPDRGQNPNAMPYGVKTKTFTAEKLESLRHQIRGWMEDNGLGSGNWGTAKVFKDNELYGYMSYNGRVWDRDDWSDKAREVKDE
jgi:hypothetical protein